MTHSEKNNDIVVSGTVIEALPNTMFRVLLDEPYQSGENEITEMISYLAGKMKYHRIRVLIGDKVDVKVDPYGGKGRVVKRK